MRVLFLDLDTLRPDHLGCYGYHRNTSPNINAIAATGVRFNNYYCSDAPCLPSRTALMTGQFGIHSGVVGQGGTAADILSEGPDRIWNDRLARGGSIPAFLRRVGGMKTALISPFAERHAAWQFYAGFNETYNTGKGGAESAEDVTPTALRWIEQNAKQDNWYLHVNYWDPHQPYRAPAEFGNPFENEPLNTWITEEILEEHRRKIGPHGAREQQMYRNQPNPRFPRQVGEIETMDDVRRVIDGYDCGIRYMDGHIGQLFDALRKQGVMDDLAIIITSDHGENLGELGIYGEHATADYVTPHIPMIIRWPGAKAGHVDDGLHYNLDLAPTFADLLRKEVPAFWDGRSYAPALLQGAPCGRDSLVLGQCAHVAQRSVRFGPWIYIRTYHDGFHLFSTEMLFNVEDDPHERNDLAGANPAVCHEAVYILNQWHDDMMSSMPQATDPLWTVMKEGGPFYARGHLKEYVKRLEETGRGYGVEELRRRHPREFR